MNILVRTILLASFVPLVNGQTLPVETSTLFSGSGNCAVCHTKGSPNTAALTDNQGQDVSPATFWRSSMMANAARDPFWQAKVQAEVYSNPHLESIIEDKCTTCHAPMGNTQAEQGGQPEYSIDEMLSDPLAMDGVSCTVCHQIEDEGLGEGESFSGGFTIGENRLIYGPFENPFTGPMVEMVNYTPTLNLYTSSSEMCATCHTLFTPFVNDAGEVAGEAPEQVPYLEWLNSVYPELGVECQTCHMPSLAEDIVQSNRPPWLGSRNPLHKHEFVGGNVFMLQMMRDFGDELEVGASAAHFDSTIARTLHLLRNSTVELELSLNWDDWNDTLEIEVYVQNLSGHKFPTGYPSRRAWVELQVEHESGDIAFHSGYWDEAGEILGLDTIYEPHHQLITNEDQIQIYQNIPADVNGNKTYTLLKIADYLKDNRLPPMGYRSEGIAADTTRVIGLATLDPDFNLSGNMEGSGADIIQYKIGGLIPEHSYQVTATLNYQSIAPRFVQDIFSYDLPEVAEFQSFYEQMDLAPIPIASVRHGMYLTSSESQTPTSALLIKTFPNPFNPVVKIDVSTPEQGSLQVVIYDLNGHKVFEYDLVKVVGGSFKLDWDPTDVTGFLLGAGVYIVQVELTMYGSSEILRDTRKIVYLK